MTNSAAYLTELHNLLNQYFNIEEVRNLCFNLGVDHENISGQGKSAWIRELLLSLGRSGRLPELVALAQQERPRVAWPPMPADFHLPAPLATDSGITPTIAHNYYGDVVHGDKISVGDITGSTGVAIGRGAQATVTTYPRSDDAQTIAAAFARLYQALAESQATAAQKAVAQQAIEKLDQQAQKGEAADEAEVRQWFDVLASILPDIAEVAIETFLNPIKGLSVVFRKIAAKAQEQKRHS